MIVRSAKNADLPYLIDLLCELFSIEADFCPDRDRQRAGLELMLAVPEARCVMVADENGEVAGMATGQLVISTAQGSPSVLVEDVIVRSDVRGRGVGQALMDAIAQWGGAKGATRMQLLADKENTPALSFYSRLGWQRTQLICLHSAMD